MDDVNYRIWCTGRLRRRSPIWARGPAPGKPVACRWNRFSGRYGRPPRSSRSLPDPGPRRKRSGIRFCSWRLTSFKLKKKWWRKEKKTKRKATAQYELCTGQKKKHPENNNKRISAGGTDDNDDGSGGANAERIGRLRCCCRCWLILSRRRSCTVYEANRWRSRLHSVEGRGGTDFRYPLANTDNDDDKLYAGCWRGKLNLPNFHRRYDRLSSWTLFFVSGMMGGRGQR